MNFFEELKNVFSNFFKKQKPELLDTYEQYLEELKCGIDTLYEAINMLLNSKKDREKLEKVIQCEHKCDRFKEKYIKILFKTKRALPFLIEDRYKIIQNLDDISDKTEEIANFVLLYPYDIYEDIQEKLKKLNNLSYDIVFELIKMVEMMENAWDEAYDKTFNIEEIKRDARAIHYQLLEALFSNHEDALRVYLTSKLIVWLYDIIQKVEEISDYLRGLIIKYPNK